MSEYTPNWVNWLLAVGGLLSGIGCLVHYNLRKKNQIRVKRAVILLFRRLRDAKWRALQIGVGWTVRLLDSAYGRSPLRVIVTVALISACYVSAICYFGILKARWAPEIRLQRSKIVREIDPVLAAASGVEIANAKAIETEYYGDSAVTHYVNYSPRDVDLRTHMEDFDWHLSAFLVTQPRRCELALLGVIDGTPWDPGIEWGPLLSLIAFNIVIDTLSLFIARIIMEWIRDATIESRAILGFLCLATGTMVFVLFSFAMYSLFIQGLSTIFLILLGIPAGILAALAAIGCLIGAVSKEGCGLVAYGVILSILSYGTLSWSFRRLRLVWRLNFFHLHSNDITPVWVMLALLCVAPAISCILTVVIALLAQFLGDGIRRPLVWYLRMVVRMPAPALITLTATPAAVGAVIKAVYAIKF